MSHEAKTLLLIAVFAVIILTVGLVLAYAFRVDNDNEARCKAAGGVIKPYVGCIDKHVLIDLP